jgi:hypothetical protein
MVDQNQWYLEFSKLILLILLCKYDVNITAMIITRWGTGAQASIGFGTHGGFPIVVDGHKIEY